MRQQFPKPKLLFNSFSYIQFMNNRFLSQTMKHNSMIKETKQKINKRKANFLTDDNIAMQMQRFT